MAAPSKLTAATQAAICEATADGLTLARTCRLLGVHRGTVARWLREGKAQRKGPKRSFYDALTRAREELIRRRLAELAGCCRGGFVTRRTTRIDAQGNETVEETVTPPDFRAIAWHLERAAPREFWVDKKRLAELEKKVKELEAAHAAFAPPGTPA